MKLIQLWSRYLMYWIATIIFGVGCWRIGHNTWSAVGQEHEIIVVGGILTGVLGMLCYFMVGWLIQPVVKWCWGRVRHQKTKSFVDMLKF